MTTDFLDHLQIADCIRNLRTYGKPLTREASGRLDDQIRILALEINKALDEQVNRRKGQS